MHLCCGPCGAHISEELKADYQVSLFFANSNIDTAEEFAKRLAAAQTLAEYHGLPLVVDDYNHAEWLALVKGWEDESSFAKAMADEPEKGERCRLCYRYRLLKTVDKCAELGGDYFATSLSVSPYKDGEAVVLIGRSLSPKFLERNFSQNNGWQKSIAAAKSLKLYRQNYCGCEFSKRQGKEAFVN